MSHATAMSQDTSSAIRVTCEGSLIDPNDSFSSDVNWRVFTCAVCLATVFTVEGRVHWWNHHGEPSEYRRDKQERMREARKLLEAGKD